MKIAIDIDGTITAYPKQLKKIMKNNYCIILTGSLNPNADINHRINQLKKYNITENDYKEIIQCIGKKVVEVAQKKGEYCRNNKIDLIFEDTELYLHLIKKISPKTACFIIYKD
jgi:hypothetical protein